MDPQIYSVLIITLIGSIGALWLWQIKGVRKTAGSTLASRVEQVEKDLVDIRKAMEPLIKDVGIFTAIQGEVKEDIHEIKEAIVSMHKRLDLILIGKPQ